MPARRPPTRIKPPALRRGDIVGIVAPASDIKREELEAGCGQLRGLGYKTLYFDSIFEKDLYFAGSAQRRADELHEMFERDDVRAIICARGGYGSNYLLSLIDPQTMISHPKIFVGYSDLTTLLTFLNDACGLVTFHGPMVAKDFARAGGVDVDSWNAALSGQTNWVIGPDSGAKLLREGTAQGILYGGCLSMLVTSLGTPYEIQTAGTILFVEDVATKPFQIDRMLMQLKLAGKFEGVQAILFGEMLDCVQTKDQGYTLEEVVLRVVGDLGIPVAFGLRSGHVSGANITLPFGVQASVTVEASQVALKIVEAATVLVQTASSAIP
jgi:muramoyltetrapeptide carboxypeptidase